MQTNIYQTETLKVEGKTIAVVRVQARPGETPEQAIVRFNASRDWARMNVWAAVQAIDFVKIYARVGDRCAEMPSYSPARLRRRLQVLKAMQQLM